jgi:hypothetical protein
MAADCRRSATSAGAGLFGVDGISTFRDPDRNRHGLMSEVRQ